MSGEDWERPHRERLVLIRAALRVHDDAHRFLDLIAASDDERDAVRRVRAAYHVDDTTARAMVDMQFVRLTREGRERLTEELTSLEALTSEEGCNP